jgi:hypothetical protein
MSDAPWAHTWKTSTRCGPAHACVQVSIGHAEVRVRNSTRPEVYLPLTPDQWRALIRFLRTE